MKKILPIVLIIITMFVISACAGASYPASAPELETMPGVAVSDMAFEESAEPGRSTFSADRASQNQVEERLVIRNANLTLVVESPADSVAEISALAETMGGFVVSSNVYESTFDQGVRATRASITVRIPAERLNEALSEIKAGAVEVRSENISGEDVTQEYTDLQSRLRNLEAAEEELREIMGSLTKAEDVLRVYESLRQVREEIEIIKGRMQYFEQSARLSAVTIELLPDVVSQPLQIGRWQPEGTAKEAFETVIRAFQFLADAAIWFVILVLPILFLLSLPFWVIRWFVIKRRARKQSRGSEEE
ncbi:MAG: DUF4349 domain-containing protein [Anaerolineales bacterium]|nr:DUF4349 domain-containing protein [Anaerolineales bacterium]